MLERGDIIVTPSWHWHDHGSEGDGPMVWLDGLDLPMYHFLPVGFAGSCAESRHPRVVAENSSLKFPWAKVAAALDADAETEPCARYHYRYPDSGAHLSKTISAQAERVSAGTTTKPLRETVSFVYHVYEGEGYSAITPPGGKEKKVEWKARDTFSVPAWDVVSNTSAMKTGSAYLPPLTTGL